MRQAGTRSARRVAGLTLAIGAVLVMASVPASGDHGNRHGKGQERDRTGASLSSSCQECPVSDPVSFSGAGFDPAGEPVTIDVGGYVFTAQVGADGYVVFEWTFGEPGAYEVEVRQRKNGRHPALKASAAITVVPTEGPNEDDEVGSQSTTTTVASTTTTVPPTTTTVPSTTTTTTEPAHDGSPVAQPPSDRTTDDIGGRFRVSCDFSHRAQVDPIVAPFQESHHVHDFFGNSITSDDPSYSRMQTAGSSCGLSTDTAAYWFPSLQAPDGSFVEPVELLFYYRARPVGYEFGTSYFPPSFKMIAGGLSAPDMAAYWTCKGESDTGYADRKLFIPDCTGIEEERLVAHVFFPSCWDGANLDSMDHRSHVAYGLDDGEVVSTDPDTCPTSHPYKLPQLDLRVVYPVTNGVGYRLADGTQVPHADFWNTWQQSALEDLIDRCLRAGENCGGVSD